MKVFVTKHALTEGIVEVEAEVSPRSNEVIRIGEGLSAHHYRKPDWHEDRIHAVRMAEQLRFSRMVELGDELKRLKELNFE